MNLLFQNHLHHQVHLVYQQELQHLTDVLVVAGGGSGGTGTTFAGGNGGGVVVVVLVD
jgi:hypothetical protein